MGKLVKDFINLDFYSPKFKSLLEDYILINEQLNYTALPMDAVKKGEMDDERHSVVILNHTNIVGFFVLHEWGGAKQYTNNRNAILLRAYSIDSRYQGRGFAKQSLKLLTPFVKKYFPQKNEIILAVNHANMVAQRVYKNSGFVDNGTRLMGRKGELMVMSKEIFK